MNADLKQRRHKRKHYLAPIMIADEDTRFYYRAKLFNYSKTGLYFESDHQPEPGSTINIYMEKYSPKAKGIEAHKGYLAKVKWTKEILDEYTFYYGIGAEISGPI